MNNMKFKIQYVKFWTLELIVSPYQKTALKHQSGGLIFYQGSVS